MRLPLRAAATITFAAWLMEAYAQPIQTQIERVRQTDRFITLDGPVSEGAGNVSAALAPMTSDEDDLGAQFILKRQPKLKPFSVFGGLSAFHTSNVALTRNDPLPDRLLVANFGLSARPKITSLLTGEVTVRAEAFRYDEFNHLDFNSVDAGGGFEWKLPKLANITLIARYNYTALFSEQSGDKFFENHTIGLGAQRAFYFGRAQTVTIGAASVFGFSDPKPAQRDEHGVTLGYNVHLTRRLEAELDYRFAYYVYRETDRNDCNHTVSAAVRYNFTEWMSASVFGSYGANRSDRRVFDYNVLNAGFGLALNFRF